MASRNLMLVPLALLGLSACADAPPSAERLPPGTNAMMPVSDETFANSAAASDQFEIQSSQLILSRSQNPAVRGFAQQMVQDHTDSTNRLKAILAAEGKPGPNPYMTPAQTGMLAQIRNAGDPDTVYMQKQALGHEDAVMLFSAYSLNGGDPQLRAFAQQTLPVIQSHRDMVRQISGF